jgi:hypothetical protein
MSASGKKEKEAEIIEWLRWVDKDLPKGRWAQPDPLT